MSNASGGGEACSSNGLGSVESSQDNEWNRSEISFVLFVWKLGPPTVTIISGVYVICLKVAAGCQRLSSFQ
nr:hypothetical protein CFP56_78575 [Quercus suber]